MNQLPEKDLPPGRHRLLKEHLMTEIRQEEKQPVRRPWLRPALVAGAVAAVTAVTLTFTVPSGSGEPATPQAAPSSPASRSAAALLEDIALAAEHADVPGDIRDDQFVYVRSKVSWSGYDMSTGIGRIEPVREREAWESVDGSRRGAVTDLYRKLDRTPTEADRGDCYRTLQTLPTDPDEMYDWLNRTSQGHNSKNEANFSLVADLVNESLMPPAQAAALYRAAAEIPDVFVIDDEVDAAGRHGVAIARDDRGRRFELIFDKETKEYLGERQVALKDGEGIKKGDVIARTAVLERAVVDRAGLRP
ncbi:CU044_5270 family protein [Streptomyces sp. NPDC001536]|uniref:CU044_5270 family protein n=1 Tax=Streptomyces sp. NPDC001536 TaxID=3364583 RepID=UPI0036A313FD